MMKATVVTSLLVASLVFPSTSFARGGYGHHRGGHHGYDYHWSGHHGHHDSIAGALIVGGMLGYFTTARRYREPQFIYRTVYVEPRDTQPTGYYRKESNGQCYLINHKENGDQIATVVPGINCDT